VDANTQATEKLTSAFNAFTEKINETLFDHERRISKLGAAVPKRLETRLKAEARRKGLASALTPTSTAR
jgi:hypothetical protein